MLSPPEAAPRAAGSLPFGASLALTAALVLLYEAGSLFFLGVLGRPRTGLLLTGPVLVLLPLAIVLRRAGAPARETVRWAPVAPASAALAVVAVVAAVPPVLAVATRFVTTPPRVEEFFTALLRAGSSWDLAVVVLAAAVVPAVTEEIVFRGLLQRALERRLGRWPGILLAAAAFGVIHGVERAPTAAALGILLGWVTSRSGSVLPAILAHGAVNGLAVSLVNSPGFGTGLGWPETLPLPALLAWTAIGAAALVAFTRRETPSRPGSDPG